MRTGRETTTTDANGHRLLIAFAVAVLLEVPAYAQRSSAVAEDPRLIGSLAVRDSITRELPPFEIHRYELELSAGQYLRAALFEHEHALSATIEGPDGRELLHAEGGRAFGRQAISLVAPLSGRYVLNIRHATLKALQSGYRIDILAIRAPTAEDCMRHDAESGMVEANAMKEPSDARCGLYQKVMNTADALGDMELKAEGLYQSAISCTPTEAAVHSLNDVADLGRALGEQSLQASALSGRADAYSSLGDTGMALRSWYAVMETCHRMGNRACEAWSLNRLGQTLKEAGDFDGGLASCSRALSVAEAAGDLSAVATALNNLGTMKHDLGRWTEALSYYHRSLPVYHAAQWSMEAAAIHNIGVVYLDQGDPQRAVPFFRQSLSISRNAGEAYGEGMSLYRLGIALEEAGQLDDARTHLTRALAAYESVQDPRRAGLAQLHLGRVAVANNDFDKAFGWYERALSISRAVAYPMGEAMTLKDRGDAWLACGAPQRALDDYTAALALFRSLGQNLWRARTLTGAAEALEAAGQIVEARATIDEALMLIEQLQTNVTSRELKGAYLSSVRRAYDVAIRLLMRMHELQPSNNYDQEALTVSEQARGRSLLETLEESGVDGYDRVPQDLLQRQLRLRQSLTAAVERQARKKEAMPDDGATAATVMEIATLTDSLDEVERQINAAAPAPAAITGRLLRVDEIQQLVDKETVVVEYALGETSSFSWVVSRDSISSYVLPSRGAIEVVARNFIRLLQDRPAESHSGRALREVARKLADMLLSPAADRLQAKRLVIVSDGILHYIPFAALPSPEGGVPLIDRYEIVSVPSASILAALRQPRERLPSQRRTVAVFADPVFRRSDPRVRHAAPQVKEVAQARSSRAAIVRDAGLDLSSLSRLPFSRREAKAILSLADPSDRKEALDFGASRAAALTPELSQYRVVHFATHGFFNTAHPELSGIILSLVNENGREQDGLLLTSDVFGMKLNADVVVLSGCRTALGRDVRGEGISGISRAFLCAGARNVVASLWKVDDAATAALMTQFYRGMFIDHKTAAAALRAAQASLRRESRWASPYYWAAFVLQGDWK